ncbi:universal stress protein family domain protein [Talaromyces stipitatus ATCC 10500]|uniref:Universal stress protein family domain protein n=1 Tax=Talaromyces stipitatus (strain ATCC 10500 / CBS 375.48 / QM 6759 / NRRL 1006) TaxID=441959 RepID=B8MCA5_TALSN|nr:universal stress protein family domain protein [Talaromyces stipitatus ATCC 10500]EED18551.1 universal stress protein family domain protein [Talaromyces stipitatus ATCC 10500]
MTSATTSPDPVAPILNLPITTESSADSTTSSRSDNRRISFAGEDPPRRRSAQSSGSDSQPLPESTIVSSGRQTPVLDGRFPKRISSPPPPSTYQRGVSFDTFDNRDATDGSFTLKYKHKNYQATRRSRTFLCGTDQNDYSEFALEWLIDELVDDGDEVICLWVVEKDSKIASDASMDEGRYRKEAEKLLSQVIAKNQHDEKAISLVLELAVGKVQDIIQRMIRIYEPAVLIVGTRGRSLSGMQGLLPGSVSKYCLQQSPIPVVVVRPSTKREKKKKKRLADPTRRSYGNILQISEQQGSGLFNKQVSSDTNVAKLPADEAAAVAEAVGLPRHFQHAHTGSDSRLSTTSSTEEDNSKDALRSDSPQLSPDIEDENAGRVLKSPGLGNLDTPPDSEDESDTETTRGRDPSSSDVDETTPSDLSITETEEDITPLTSKLQLADAS